MELLRPRDVAEALGVSVGRVYQLIGTGVIPHTRVGGAIRIPRLAWEKWLAEINQRAVDETRELRKSQWRW